jgi:hypothetical protein
LSLTNVISPEWFFGAPLIGAGVTGIIVMSRAPGHLVNRSRHAIDLVENFAQARQLIRKEAEIEHRLELERDRVLNALTGGDRAGLAEHLGHDSMTQRLRQVEGRRQRSMDEIERLSRAEAVAHAKLIGAAQERGIRRAHLLKPDELISAIFEEPGPEAPGSLGKATAPER